jgi:hypothetical protein
MYNTTINSIASLSFDADVYEMYLNIWIAGIESGYRY